MVGRRSVHGRMAMDRSDVRRIERRCCWAKRADMERMVGPPHKGDLFDITETNDAFESPLVPLPEKPGGGHEDEEEFVFPFIPSPKRVDGLALDKLGLQSLYLDAETPQRDAYGRAAEHKYRQEADARIEGVRARLQATRQTKRNARDQTPFNRQVQKDSEKTPCASNNLQPSPIVGSDCEKRPSISKIATPAVLKERNFATPVTGSIRAKDENIRVSNDESSPMAKKVADIYSAEHLERLMQQEEEAFKCKSGVQNSPDGPPKASAEKRLTAEERHHNLWSRV